MNWFSHSLGVSSGCYNHDPIWGSEQTKEHLCKPKTPETPCCGAIYESTINSTGWNSPLDTYLACFAAGAPLVDSTTACESVHWQGSEKIQCEVEVAWSNKVKSCSSTPKHTETTISVGGNDYSFSSSFVDCFAEPPSAALSAGATAGIVVGGILGPFALGLAYKSLMYK